MIMTYNTYLMLSKKKDIFDLLMITIKENKLKPRLVMIPICTTFR